MAVERFLGGAWAMLHGPTEPRGLLTWVLDRGFAGVVPAPGPRPVEWRRLREALVGLPVRVPAVRVSGLVDPKQIAEAGLCSNNAADVESAVAAVAGAVALARDLGCETVVLEPGVLRWTEPGPVDLAETRFPHSAMVALEARRADLNTSLDAACRNLHYLARAFPETRFCLTPSRHVAGLGEVVALGAIFEDLSRERLYYWHDTAAVACRQAHLGEAPGEFLEKFAKRLAGITLGDREGGRVYLPPGTGGVDYPLLSNYRQRSARALPAVVELDLGVTPEDLPGIHAFLNKFGL